MLMVWAPGGDAPRRITMQLDLRPDSGQYQAGRSASLFPSDRLPARGDVGNLGGLLGDGDGRTWASSGPVSNQTDHCCGKPVVGRLVLSADPFGSQSPPLGNLRRVFVSAYGSGPIGAGDFWPLLKTMNMTLV